MGKRIIMSYDKDADVMYFSFGKPRKAVSEELGGGVVARYDPASKALVGFTVINFSKRFATAKEITIPEVLV